MASRIRISDAGASSPTALPIWAALLLALVKIKTIRFSALFSCLSRAKREAIWAMRATRSGNGRYSVNSADFPPMPALNDSGTVMTRPSNSGNTTFIAASRGLSPRSDCSHWSCVMLLAIACRTGTFSCSSKAADQLAGVDSPWPILPIANEVVLINTSIWVPCLPLK